MLLRIKEFFHSEVVTVPEAIQQPYFATIDGMRGVAILLVLFSHLVMDGYFPAFFTGNAGVEIFFVLSGFLITTLLIKEKLRNGRISLKSFYIRRALRILPVAYLFLAVLAVLNYVFFLHIPLRDFLGSAFFVKNLPLNFGNKPWYSGHFWTLSIEEQFYLLFPWLLVLNLNSYLKLICILIIGLPLLQYVGYNHVSVFESVYLLHRITFFTLEFFGNGTISILIGSLLSILLFKNILKIKKFKLSPYLTLFLLIAGITFRTICQNPFYQIDYSTPIFSVLIAIIIFLNFDSTNILAKILNHPILIKIGILSYSIYIWQELFTHNQPWINTFKDAGSPFFNMPALFITAYFCYTFFERGFLKLKTHFK